MGRVVLISGTYSEYFHIWGSDGLDGAESRLKLRTSWIWIGTRSSWSQAQWGGLRVTAVAAWSGSLNRLGLSGGLFPSR